MNKTFSPTAEMAEQQREWYIVDAAGLPLGRVCSAIARLLRGKHKPIWAPHIDTGDFVVVINAEKTVLTGRKEQQKVYYTHTGRPGSLRSINAADRRVKHPTRMIEDGVWGMLPKNRLGRRQLKKLKVYAGVEHPHEAQQPQAYDLNQVL